MAKFAVKNTDHCICLARVSTSKQSYSEQVRDLKELAIKDGYKESNIFVINNKESGIKLDEEHRLGLIDMKNRIESDSKINAVYVRSIDRIGRKEEVNLSIKNYLIDRKIQLVIKTPSLRLLEDDGKVNTGTELAFSLFNTMAKQEMEIKKDRFAQGKREAVRNNKVICGKVVFGYTTDSNNVIIPDNKNADIVRYIFNAYANTEASTSTIYRELLERGDILNTYTFPTGGVNFIRNIIVNEAYKGGRSKTNKIIEFHYPAIVSEELWQKANLKIEKKCYKPLYNTKHILYAKGLVKCDCGYTMIGNVDALLNYRCNNGCKRVINLNVIEHIAWEEAKQFKIRQIEAEPEQNKKKYQSMIHNNDTKITAITEQITQLDAKLSRAYKGYVNGGINESDYNETVKRITKERHKLEASKTSLEVTNTNLNDMIRRQDELDTFTIFGGLVAISDDNERRKIVQEVIEKLVVSDYENGMLITIVCKNGEVGFNKYFYKPSTRPKTYWMYEDFFTKKLMMYKEITDEIEKRFNRRRYDKRKAINKTSVIRTAPTILDD